jgi:hypothetical protein
MITNQEIEELLNETAAPCVSIVVPTHRFSSERIKDTKAIEMALNQAKELLKKRYKHADYYIDNIIQSIDKEAEKIDYIHPKDGIGIFVSPYITKTVKFPFPVIEKIKVGAVFDSRDLLYQVYTIIDYCVLSISKKYIHLFKGKGEELFEIKNEDFPIDYQETYEYEKTSRGTSFSDNALKAFERDKSVLQEVRLVDFLKTADHLLEKYINSHVPLIVSGGAKELADYLQVTKHKKRIIGKVTGNYAFNGNVQLANLSWMEVKQYIKNKNKILLDNLHELIGKNMVVTGIIEVWKAANEGKGLELIVEKDFEHPAFISTDGYDLQLHQPSDKKKYTLVSDAIERIINIVREKKGKIMFVDNDEMKDFNKIALHLRYNNNSHL